MECHGGPGYIEESIMPRLYREAPVNSIWEGSGNIICLDVLRAMFREQEAIPALLDELDTARGVDLNLDRAVNVLKKELNASSEKGKPWDQLIYWRKQNPKNFVKKLKL